MRKSWSAVAAGLALLATALPAAAFDLPGEWRSAHFRDNPLVGSLRTGEGQALDMARLDAALAGARYVLVGETHDNPDHHRIQAAIVAGLAGRRPAVVFEMITADEAPALAAFLARPGRAAAGLGPAVRWTERGWPDFAMYQPIVEAALGAGLTLLPGDLGRESVRAIGRKGRAAVSDTEAARLGLDRAMPAEAEAALTLELKESHCGMLPDKALPGMLMVQRARDGALADALTAAAVPTGAAVLIAGTGHVRRDWAVPALIAAREPAAAVVSIGLLEVPRADADLATLGISDADPAPYDFVLFTPKAEVSDPCAGMAEAMKGKAAPPSAP